jgi:xylulokinase
MLYAGLDCSTQSMTAVVIDAVARDVVFRESLAFDQPFVCSGEPGVVHASPRMWASAVRAIVARIASEVDVTRLRALSGSAQQHGSVYCGESPETLTRESSPIWMDTSTAHECAEIESALGGGMKVARLTGSRCYPRFTGPQIRKFARTDPAAYERTACIHLVSSYLASLLAGRHAAIDHADGSGMNLMDLRTRQWSDAALKATAPDLRGKLPPLVPSSAVVGTLRDDWQRAFGLPPVRLVAWSGDNPCSLVGTGLVREGQLAISLGTSDTIFGPMNAPRVSDDGTGHVFASPLGEYMGITVFRNGSLARERVRDQFGMNWHDFSEGLRRTPAGNDGATLLPWFEPEITPRVDRPVPLSFGLDGASPERHVRAVVEGQAIALRRHSAWMHVSAAAIHATGGAAANRAILQVLADVFDAPVLHFPATDAAALGAALRALQADTGVAWDRATDGFTTPSDSAVLPIPANVDALARLRQVHGEREAAALRERL